MYARKPCNLLRLKINLPQSLQPALHLENHDLLQSSALQLKYLIPVPKTQIKFSHGRLFFLSYRHPSEGSALLERTDAPFFYLLCSCFKTSNIRRTTGGTFFYIRNRISAVMTNQFSIPVRRQGHITMRTFHYMPACPTTHKSGITSSV